MTIHHGGVRRGYVDTSFGQMHYRECGRQGGSGKQPLLMLHQSPSSSVMYEKLMGLLADEFTLYAPDLPGFGGSDPLPEVLTMASAAAAVKEFAQALDIGSCDVFGHHTGAAVAVQYSYDNADSVRRLALSGPTLLSEKLKQALPSKATPFPLEEDGSHLLGMWQRMRGKETEAPLELVLREAMLGLQLGDAYPEAYSAVIEHDCETQLKALQCPVLVFCGDKDPLYSCLDNAYDCLQQGQKAVLPGAASYACELYADEVSALLRDFFNG